MRKHCPTAQKHDERVLCGPATLPTRGCRVLDVEHELLQNVICLGFNDYYHNLFNYLNQRSIRQHQQAMPDSFKSHRVQLSLDDFQLLSQIGQGGYGQVYLARKTDTGEMCAIKKMNKRLLHKLNEVQHVLTERDVLTTSSSPWLVKLFYAFQDAECLYLAMEYVPGGDLRTLLNHSGILRDKNARFYFAEMATAVDALHQSGYIHRDLKPENFLIDATGHIKLTDFGLSNGALSQAQIETIREKYNSASHHLLIRRDSKQKRTLRMLKQNTASRAFSTVGSPDYMAPEVLSSAVGGYDHLVDYWSLGCVLFEFLAGYAPFAGATTDEVWHNIRHWERVLERPRFNNALANLNFTDEAWSLVTQLVTHREHRLSRLESIQQHPYFRRTNWHDLRAQQAPFVPKLSAPDDNTYFDDFTNPADMAAYRDVLQRQANMDAASEGNPSTPSQITFVGFTFRHQPARFVRNRVDSTACSLFSPMFAEKKKDIEQQQQQQQQHGDDHKENWSIAK
ncbi:kinase-like domain-containing protein [Syncephalis pseudoplumigaleata]|uniref:non-specific serine/threonine protein kinase n=1 Tax=Syncephalis pseudoplumigaleata TaxID=1712513 RepID=A0A4P9Z7E5_9FUNG|nr:kinase-like domain-containing protein [Syncephalis pseudoplumigaleata]|eukprot:RKP27821.1 kinase-like domain-containing protein [Syncephalis pseudoplumigaleata]